MSGSPTDDPYSTGTSGSDGEVVYDDVATIFPMPTATPVATKTRRVVRAEVASVPVTPGADTFHDEAPRPQPGSFGRRTVAIAALVGGVAAAAAHGVDDSATTVAPAMLMLVAFAAGFAAVLTLAPFGRVGLTAAAAIVTAVALSPATWLMGAPALLATLLLVGLVRPAVSGR